MRFGFHLPIRYGVAKVPALARKLGCKTVQLFSRSPRMWRPTMQSEEALAAMREGLCALGVAPVALHTIYLVNLASPDKKLWEMSLDALAEELRRAPLFGAQFVVTHLGSAGGDSLAAGLKRAARAVRRALDCCDAHVRLLLENSAGSGNIVGARFAELAEVFALADDPRLGLCFDTAHAFASGYNVASATGLRETLAEIDREIGLARLLLVHLNDSKAPLGSRIDRHAHIGQGEIGPTGLGRIVCHPRLRRLPFIMETPIDHPGDDLRNMRRLRAIVRRMEGRAR